MEERQQRLISLESIESKIKAYLFTVSLECKDIPFFTLVLEIDASLILLVQLLYQFNLKTIFISGYFLDRGQIRIIPKTITTVIKIVGEIDGNHFKHGHATNLLRLNGLNIEDLITNVLFLIFQEVIDSDCFS
jgi:hypothetical protein